MKKQNLEMKVGIIIIVLILLGAVIGSIIMITVTNPKRYDITFLKYNSLLEMFAGQKNNTLIFTESYVKVSKSKVEIYHEFFGARLVYDVDEYEEVFQYGEYRERYRLVNVADGTKSTMTRFEKKDASGYFVIDLFDGGEMTLIDDSFFKLGDLVGRNIIIPELDQLYTPRNVVEVYNMLTLVAAKDVVDEMN